MWPILVAALLTGPAPAPPSVVHDGLTPPRAWAVLDGSGFWVCWDAQDPQCWSFVAGPPGAAVVELGFADGSTLLVGTADGRAHVLDRGGRATRDADHRDLSPLVSPRRLPCATGNRRPVLTAAGPAFEPCIHRRQCPTPAPRVRGRPLGLGLHLGLSSTHRRDRVRDEAGQTRRVRSWGLMVVLRAGFDPGRLVRDRLALASYRATFRRRAAASSIPCSRSRP